MLVAAAGLILYCGGLWFLLMHLLPHLKKTRSLGDKVPLLVFGWLYDMFEAKVRQTVGTSFRRSPSLLGCRSNI